MRCRTIDRLGRPDDKLCAKCEGALNVGAHVDENEIIREVVLAQHKLELPLNVVYERV